MPAAAMAAAASGTDGIWIVEPRTTLPSAGRPLYAASARFVRLLAEAIVHRVSPGATVCGTAALAVVGSAAAIKARARGAMVRRTRDTSRESCLLLDDLCSPDPSLAAGYGRPYVELQSRLHLRCSTT